MKLDQNYRYFPKASKTVLIVKKPEDLEMSKAVFAGSGVQVTSEGERHLGAVLGSDSFKAEYVSKKVLSWVKDIKDLSDIAKEEPQIAFSAYTKGLSHRWSYLQRTVGDISELFRPLEEAIRDELIPSIIGRKVSDVERSILALPLRH